MPYTIERHPEQPIFFVDLTGYITPHDTMGVYLDSHRLRCDNEHIIYRVVDVNHMQCSFMDLMAIINQAKQVQDEAIIEQNVILVFVGRSHWSQLFKQAISKSYYGGYDIPHFDTREQALQYIQRLRTS